MAVCSESYMAVCDEVQQLRQKLEASEARVAELTEFAVHHAAGLIATAADQGLDVEAQNSAYLSAMKGDGRAWILHKQAEAVEALLPRFVYDRQAHNTLKLEAQRLREKADKLELGATLRRLASAQERNTHPQMDAACSQIEHLTQLFETQEATVRAQSDQIDALEAELVEFSSPGRVQDVRSEPISDDDLESAYDHFLRLERNYPDISTARYTELGRFKKSVRSLCERLSEERVLELSFQARVAPWVKKCFGAEIAADGIERNHRFLEEAMELVQSLGMTRAEALQLVDYVYNRPAGDPPQEVGGVMVTLAALCLAARLDMHQCGETELSRIWTKVPEIRAKQATKPKSSPLPAHPESEVDA